MAIHDLTNLKGYKAYLFEKAKQVFPEITEANFFRSPGELQDKKNNAPEIVIVILKILTLPTGATGSQRLNKKQITMAILHQIKEKKDYDLIEDRQSEAEVQAWKLLDFINKDYHNKFPEDGSDTPGVLHFKYEDSQITATYLDVLLSHYGAAMNFILTGYPPN